MAFIHGHFLCMFCGYLKRDGILHPSRHAYKLSNSSASPAWILFLWVVLSVFCFAVLKVQRTAAAAHNSLNRNARLCPLNPWKWKLVITRKRPLVLPRVSSVVERNGPSAFSPSQSLLQNPSPSTPCGGWVFTVRRKCLLCIVHCRHNSQQNSY